MRIRGLFACFFLAVLVFAIVYVPTTRASLYRDYDVFMEAFKSLADAHPEMVTYESVGKTVENNDIILFKIGNPAGVRVLFDGAMHGSETLGSEVLYCYAQWLLTSNDALAKRILAGTYTLLVPALNVDSYNRVRTNAHHVDLNRNFATHWTNAGSNDSSNPDWGDYHGSAPLSEPESQTMVRLFRTLEPRFYANLHYPGGTYYLGSSYANRTYNSLLVEKIDSLSKERGVKPYPYYETNGPGFAISDAARAGITSFLIELTSNATLPLSKVGTLVLPKLIPIAAVFGQESENNVSSVLFTDSFESGDFSSWDGNQTTPGERLSVTSSVSKQGFHSAFFTSNGGDPSETAYSYKRLQPSASLFARGYFIGTSFVATANYSRFYFAAFIASGQAVAMAGVRRSGDAIWWRLAVMNGTNWVIVDSGAASLLNQWHRFELQWAQSPTVGYGKLYVDDKLVCSVSAINTTAFGAVNSAEFGIAMSGGSKTAFYLDYIQLSTNTLGPLPIPEDLNQDGKVNMRDIAIVVVACAFTMGSQNWNPLADLNADGIVNMRDVAIVVTHFGEQYR